MPSHLSPSKDRCIKRLLQPEVRCQRPFPLERNRRVDSCVCIYYYFFFVFLFSYLSSGTVSTRYSLYKRLSLVARYGPTWQSFTLFLVPRESHFILYFITVFYFIEALFDRSMNYHKNLIILIKKYNNQLLYYYINIIVQSINNRKDSYSDKIWWYSIKLDEIHYGWFELSSYGHPTMGYHILKHN